MNSDATSRARERESNPAAWGCSAPLRGTTSPADRDARDNPFSSRFTRPGAIAYRFGAGQSAEQAIERLRQAGWLGQITGAHGSGKSTLLAALIPRLQALGKTVVLLVLHDGQRSLPVTREDQNRWTADHLVVVDGYEQLGFWQRLRLKRRCRRRKCGLLVTCHGTAGLPTTAVCQSSLDVVLELVDNLTVGLAGKVTPVDVKAVFQAQAGDVREVFFDLYDLYEDRRIP